MSSKIIKLSELKNIEDCSLTYGHFDNIHPGHIRYLKYAKSISNFLIVAIIGDIEKEKLPIFQFNQKERSEALAMLELADLIVKLEEDELSEVVKKVKPRSLVLGKEKETEDNQELEIKKAINYQKKQGRAVEFRAGEINYATTELLSQPQKELEEERKKEFLAACNKQNIDVETLLKAIDNFQSTKLIVVGDVIVDQYAACEALGISAEAPVIVVKELKQKNFLGGAGIVASHIKAIGAKCDLFSVIGNDENNEFVHNIVSSYNIGNFIIEDPNRPTTLKKRYLVDNQKLFRVSRLEDNCIDKDIEKKIIKNIKLSAREASGIVISDFVYGVVTEGLIESICEIAKEYNLKLIADLQCSSQIGSITKFKDFSLLCPNEKEARISLQDNINSVEFLSQKLLSITRTRRLLMKLGASGFIAYDNNTKGKLVTQSFPALSVNPVDVSGAGDSLLAIISTGLASGQSMMVSAALAACMSALAVKNMGNIPIKEESLRKFIVDIFK